MTKAMDQFLPLTVQALASGQYKSGEVHVVTIGSGDNKTYKRKGFRLLIKRKRLCTLTYKMKNQCKK